MSKKYIGLIITMGLLVFSSVFLVYTYANASGATAVDKEQPKTADNKEEKGGSSIENQIQSMRKDILAIRKMVSILLVKQLEEGKMPKPKKMVKKDIKLNIDLAKYMQFGNDVIKKDQPIVMIEFTDPFCGWCKKFKQTTFKHIKKSFINNKKIGFASVGLSLLSKEKGVNVLNAQYCANKQGFNLEADNLIYNAGANADVLSSIKNIKTLNQTDFDKCFNGGEYNKVQINNLRLSNDVGVQGTPTFVVGKYNNTKKVLDGKIIVGALPYSNFASILSDITSKEK